MYLIKLFIASSLLLILLTSCLKDLESNPVLTVNKGTIKVSVYDVSTNDPINKAKITTRPHTIAAYTPEDGKFIISDIKFGDYVIEVHKPGFDKDTTLVTIKNKDTVNTVFTLQSFRIYLDYYPLEIGNYWEYWSDTKPYFSAEVISDTTIAGKKYAIIKEKYFFSQNIYYRYERVDKLNALVYRYFPWAQKEMIIDSLPAKANQNFSSNMFYEPYKICFSYCTDIEEKEVFGKLRKIRLLKQSCGTDLPEYHIVEGIGLYKTFFWRTGGYTLKYARIRGIEYGEKP